VIVFVAAGGWDDARRTDLRAADGRLVAVALVGVSLGAMATRRGWHRIVPPP
jgi:hypothetical protein